MAIKTQKSEIQRSNVSLYYQSSKTVKSVLYLALFFCSYKTRQTNGQTDSRMAISLLTKGGKMIEVFYFSIKFEEHAKL